MSDGLNTKEALVVFTPSGKRGTFAHGTPLLTAARALGVDIDSVCGGRAICGRCQVDVSVGDFAKHGISSHVDSLTDITAVETRYADKRGLKAGRRLSCQAKVQGDVVIDVPPESQVHKQVVRKRAEARIIEIDPVTTLHYLEVEEPDMHHPSSDLERVYNALASQWDIPEATCDMRILAELQPVLRKGNWSITVAVHRRLPGSIPQITGIWPGFHDEAYGLAIDVGSTTIAAHLCDLASGEVLASSGLMNPQIRFGEDLMSRVSYVMMNPGGDVEMTQAVRDAINVLAGQVTVEAGINQDDILEAVLVGNPVMHHLLLGIDPVELGGAPFALATGLAVTRPARQLNLKLHGGAHVYVLPCIAGHVGADAAAVALSESPHLSEEMTLIVDVGTNAEIILGNKERLLACSSPTGPAFEGAQISSGQRAAPGAIERVRIDPDTLEPRFRVIGCDLWSDDPGFAAATAGTGVTGICGSGIIEVMAEMYLAGVINQDGVVDGGLAAKSPRVRAAGRTFDYVLHEGEQTIAVTQNDVRAIQLAKAALYAGVRLLMDKMEIDAVERIRLAGAFGSHIDVKYAMVLGLIPDCALPKVESAGNAAGTGARIALLNGGARDEIERVVREIEKIETAVEERFQEHFVDAMAIPHKTASYPNLTQEVTLPEPKEVAVAQDGEGEGGGRRRRRRGRG
ncbi:MAG: ASKHA domain-containing protein [Pseudomonadota bacterium]